MPDRLQQFVESRRFQHIVVGVIFLSAILAGVAGIPQVDSRAGVLLGWAEQVISGLLR